MTVNLFNSFAISKPTLNIQNNTAKKTQSTPLKPQLIQDSLTLSTAKNSQVAFGISAYTSRIKNMAKVKSNKILLELIQEYKRAKALLVFNLEMANKTINENPKRIRWIHQLSKFRETNIRPRGFKLYKGSVEKASIVESELIYFQRQAQDQLNELEKVATLLHKRLEEASGIEKSIIMKGLTPYKKQLASLTRTITKISEALKVE